MNIMNAITTPTQFIQAGTILLAFRGIGTGYPFVLFQRFRGSMGIIEDCGYSTMVTGLICLCNINWRRTQRTTNEITEELN